MGLFELKYLALASSSPVVSRLEKQGFKFVDLLEASQNVNKALYAGITAINALVSSLPQADSQLVMSARLHDSSYQLASQLFKDFYLVGIDLVHCLSNEMEKMAELERLKRNLQESLGFTAPNKFVMEARLREDPSVRSAVEALVIAQSKFRELNSNRLQKLNGLLGQLNNLLSIERFLVKLLSARKSVLNYDNTINRSYVSRVMRNITRYEPVLTSAIQELNNYHVALEEAKRRIMGTESEFRSMYHIDPSQYVISGNVHSIKDLYNAYQRTSRALDTEITQLRGEISSLTAREARMNKDYQLSISRKNAFLNAGPMRNGILPFAQRNPLAGIFQGSLPSNLLANHPRIVGLASQQKSLQSMIKEQLMDVDMVVTEIRDCINRTDKDMGYCVAHLKSVKSRDLTNIQKDINYIKAQQGLARDKLRYSKILVALYRELSRVVREKEKMDISEQESAYKKNILLNIAKQLELKKSLEQSIRQLNDMRVSYAEMLDSDEVSVKKESQENLKAIGKMIEQNQKLLSIVQREQENLPAFSEPLIRAYQAKGKAQQEANMIKDIKKEFNGFMHKPLGSLIGNRVEAVEGALGEEAKPRKKEQSGGSAEQLKDELRQALQMGGADMAMSPEALMESLLMGGGDDHSFNFLSGTLLDANSIEEARTDVRNAITSVIREQFAEAGVNPQQLNEVQKLSVLISAEILYYRYMAKKYGNLTQSGYEQLANNVNNQYAITILVAMRSAYSEMRDRLRQAILKFRRMDEVLLNAYASAIRVNVKFLAEDASGRKFLQDARENLMTQIRTMEKRLDEVDNKCDNDELPSLVEMVAIGKDNINTDSLKQCSTNIENLLKQLPVMTEAVSRLNSALSEAYADVLTTVIENNLPTDKITPMVVSSFYAKGRQLALEGAMELSAVAKVMMDMKHRFSENIQRSNKIDNFLKANAYLKDMTQVRDHTDNVARLLQALKQAFEQANTANSTLREKIQEMGAKQKTSQDLIQLRFLAQERSNKVDMLREIYYQIQDGLYQFGYNLTNIFKKHYEFHAYALERYTQEMIVFVNHSYKLQDRLIRLKLMAQKVKDKFPQLMIEGKLVQGPYTKEEARPVITDFQVEQLEKMFNAMIKVYTELHNSLDAYPNTRNSEFSNAPEITLPSSDATGKMGEAYNALKEQVQEYVDNTESANINTESPKLFEKVKAVASEVQRQASQ